MTTIPRNCAISGQALADGTGMPCGALRPSLMQFIRKTHPALKDDDWLAIGVVDEFKAKYVEDVLESEFGEITSLERDVIESLREHELLSTNLLDSGGERSVGERLADHIAEFGGSWAFILSFGAFLLLWVLFNTIVLAVHPPDPYPFIFLNLLLSCVAALQAPVIMMSQNRQEARDRRQAEQDYKINLKAELEIRHLNEKLDHLLLHHSQRLLEIQQIQTDLLRQLLDKKS